MLDIEISILSLKPTTSVIYLNTHTCNYTVITICDFRKCLFKYDSFECV